MAISDQTFVNIGKAEINGLPAHTVRVVERGDLWIKALCYSLSEARQLAELEATRLGVELADRDRSRRKSASPVPK